MSYVTEVCYPLALLMELKILHEKTLAKNNLCDLMVVVMKGHHFNCNS